MCVATSGKVVNVENDIAVVDINGNFIRAHIGVHQININDRVLVHAGLIIQKLSDSEADEITALFEEIKELMDE